MWLGTLGLALILLAAPLAAVAQQPGKIPRIGQSAYAASKAGVIQLTRVLALL